MVLQAYQERVVVERDELEEKLSKLENFLQQPRPNVIGEEWARLIRQRDAMQSYAIVLQERIDYFNGDL